MKRYIALAFLLSGSPAIGHPGHGDASSGHWFSDPSHLAALAAVSVVALLVLRAVRTRRAILKQRTKD